MIFKTLIVFVLVLILGSLAMALIAMVRDKGQSERTIRALTLRIGMSIGLLVILLIGNAVGLITPHGI